MPNNPPDEGNTVAQQTDDRSQALKPALESMTLLVAAVIVHDKATNRVVLLQRSENAKFAQGMWDLPVGKSEPGEPITETAVRELYEETGLTVKPESLKVAHIIHGAWGVEAPTVSSPWSSPPTNGPANPKTANPASTPRSAGSTPAPSPRTSWTPPQAPSTGTSREARRSPSTAGARGANCGRLIARADLCHSSSAGEIGRLMTARPPGASPPHDRQH